MSGEEGQEAEWGVLPEGEAAEQAPQANGHNGSVPSLAAADAAELAGSLAGTQVSSAFLLGPPTAPALAGSCLGPDLVPSAHVQASNSHQLSRRLQTTGLTHQTWHCA